MYLLATETLADYVTGEECPLRAFVLGAEGKGLRVQVSVISLGILENDVENLPRGAPRTNWRRRLDLATSRFQTELMFDVNLDRARTWSQLLSLDLSDPQGQPLGDDERIVLATAIEQGQTLLVYESAGLQEAMDHLGLKVQQIERP